VFESLDESEVLVRLENGSIPREELLELIHVSLLDTCDDVEVGRQRLFEVGLGEHLPIRDLSHQQLNQDQQLLNLDSESLGSNLWSLPQGLNESRLSL
jgi:hypothetical protein